MDPTENPANSNAPGPPVPSSQAGFQFATSTLGGSIFGQSTGRSIFGQSVQFGSNTTLSIDRKPSNEPVYNNPFASTRSASSIFGGRSGGQTSNSTAAAAKPQAPSVIFESTEEKSNPAASVSTTVAKSRFATFGGEHPMDQTGDNTEIMAESNTFTNTQQTISSDAPEKIIRNVSAELDVAKGKMKKEVNKHIVNTVAKDRIRNIISENRVENEDKELKDLEKVKKSLLQQLASDHEKKRKSSDSNDGSPGKITKEDKALYFTLPNKTFTKTLIKEHFSTFGQVFRVYFNTTKNHCIVHFARHEDAMKAYENGSLINGCAVRLFWKNIIRSKKKSESSKEAKADVKKHPSSKKRSFEMDPEVAEELNAMGSLLEYRPHRDKNDRKKNTETASTTRKFWTKDNTKALRKENIDKTSKNFHRIELPSKEAELEPEKTEGGTAEVFIETTAGAQELVAIMKTAATSLEDRLNILEARDKLIRLGQVRQCDLAHAKKTIGVCPDMCPEKERLLRETRRQVSFYEMDESTKRMKPALAVKQYARSSADQEEPLPHELRPLPVMAMTMSYLLHCISDLCDRPGENLAEWYHYLWDRTRSIRKEITQQELCDLESVQLVEQCARFHIHCCARLAAEDVSVFDHRINTENLTKCLQTLKHMYYDLWMKQNQKCPNEPEFMSYFLLLNLNNGSVMWELEQLREDVLQTPEIDLAAKLYMAINSNNFVRFFRLVRSAPYLASCLAIRYFYQVRTLALRIHMKAFNPRDKPILYPLATIVRELAFEDFTEAENFCLHHGLCVDHSQPDTPQVLFTRNTFRIATTVFASSRSLQLVESKRKCSVGEVISGGTLPPRTFENHVPHDSFDSNGFLKQSAWYAVDQGMVPSDLSFEEEFGNVNQKDSSGTRSEVGQSGQGGAPPSDKTFVNITEPPEDDSKSTPLGFQKANSTQSQVSESQNDRRALPDIISPVVQKESVKETMPPSSGLEAPKSSFYSQTQQSTTMTTWMSQSSTSNLKSIFGTSPKNSTNVFSSNLVAPVGNTVPKSQDGKTPPIQTPFFSKASEMMNSTSSFLKISSSGGATPTFGSTIGTPAAPSFGGSTTGVTHTQQAVSTLKNPSIFGGAATGVVDAAAAFGAGMFGAAVTTTTAPLIPTATTSISNPFAFAKVKNDAIKSPSAGIPVQETSLENEISGAIMRQSTIRRSKSPRAASFKKAVASREEENKMRARILENRITSLSQESLDKLVDAEIRLVAVESLNIAKDTLKKENDERAVELSETLLTEVLLQQLEELVAEELNTAVEEREKVIRRITAKYFRRWLKKCRLSLSRKRAIENFPAGVTHLSLEEHAKRWGSPSLSRVHDFLKQDGFHVRDIPKVAHSWTSLSSLVGKEVMRRYHDHCRQLGWKHSSQVAFKVLLSVSTDFNDISSRVTEWFVRNPQQLNHGAFFEDSRLNVIRYVSTHQLAPDQIVHTSIQLIRGYRALEKTPELAAGTSAILFCMNISEDVHSCCKRLDAILESLTALPAPPVAVVVFANQNAMDAVTLNSLLSSLGLERKLRRGIISDYKVICLKDASDLSAVDCELTKVLSYTARKWSPPPHFSVKPLRTVLIRAFDMFFISLKCTLDSGLPSSNSINNPQMLAELSNEFLKYICAVLLKLRRESKLLCAPELWSNVYNAAYKRFHDDPSYEQRIASLLSSMQIPKVNGWPPGDPSGFRTWLTRSQSIVSQSTDLIDRWSKVSSWPNVLEDIPWIQVFKACIEKKIVESKMSDLSGYELCVVVDSKILEKLHNDPWWKHSRRLHAYLSKFEKKSSDPALVDISNQNNISESDPPLKKRCLDKSLVEQSIPDFGEISQMIEDHQQSLRNHDNEDSSEPKMSRLEFMIDSLQSRLGLSPYTLAKVEPEQKKIDTPKPVDPTPQEVLLDEVEIPKEAETVCQQQEVSREADKEKMKKIVVAARNIVAPLQLSPATWKLQNSLLGRAQGDLSAAKIPLSVLSKSDFVERSEREVEQRIRLRKRSLSPKVEESEEKREAYHNANEASSLSDSASLDECQTYRRTTNDRSNISEKSLNFVDAYSLTSDDEKSDYDSDNYDRESMEYDDYGESKEDSVNGDVAVEVRRFSNAVREEDESAEMEESFNEEEEKMEGEEGNLEEDEEELSGSDIKITDDEEEVVDEDVGEDEVREFIEVDTRTTNDVETGNDASEAMDENLEEEEYELEEEEYEGEEEEYEGEDGCSDVQEISSDEEVNVQANISDEDAKRRSNYTENCESSSDCD